MSELDSLKNRALDQLGACSDESTLRSWNSQYFGKNGEMLAALKKVSELPPESRKEYGQQANIVKEQLSASYETALKNCLEQAMLKSLETEKLDISLPGMVPPAGKLHLATQTLRDIQSTFAEMGFQVFRSREIEDDEFNFGLLNMPPHHPARDMWDTFHTTDPGLILRTHTSPGQIHVMRKFHPAPIRVILPGMCYRYEAITTRSEIMFHQVEGLVVGSNVSMTDLIGTITAFTRKMFGDSRQVRIRSSYFPFTEPSIEVDMDCIVCGGKGCPLCKKTGWLEIMGAGMVHPEVMKNGGYDPAKYSGFAFGMGPERIAMLRHAIEDIREFWGNDLRFLSQF